MSEYVLSCCSTADLSREHFEKRDIHYICFHYFLDDKGYPDDLGQTMPFDKFYQAMVDGADTRTSQINQKEYETYFASFLKEGKDVVHLSLSSGLSGSVNSARLAKESVEARYPGRTVYVVDSLAASSGFGLLMDKLADLRDEGMSAADLAAWAENNRLRLQHWFFSTDLTFYVKGGRVSKTSGFIGNLLNICPLLNVNNEGRLIPRQKIRTKRKVIAEIVKRMAEHAENRLDYAGKCFISHSACIEDAQAVAALIKEKFPRLNGDVEINSIGTTIGSHTGPGTVALFFWGDERGE
ncbi:MAG: DegV family protein [Clostridia bacterium]|nr:DegV family protein [Clostridia bacterium]